MANSDVRYGLRPVRHRNGAPYNGGGTPYFLPSNYGTAMFVGDPVVITGDANTALITAPGAGEFPPGTIQAVNKATVGDGNAITGPIVAFATNPQNSQQLHNPASTERVVFVEDNPDTLFSIQADGTVTAAMVGLNAVLIYTHSGSTVTGMSGAELDTGTTTAPAADASYQLTIQAIENGPDNELATDNPRVLVQINNHSRGYAAIGIS